MKILIIFFTIFLLLLSLRLWIGHGSYPEVWRLENQITLQNIENDAQLERNRQLRAEIENLNSGNTAMEERARSELGMIKYGETFYQVILKEQQQKTVSKPKRAVD